MHQNAGFTNWNTKALGCPGYFGTPVIFLVIVVMGFFHMLDNGHVHVGLKIPHAQRFSMWPEMKNATMAWPILPKY